ncbi:response regulator transcription factor [Sphingomicrobium astaxanthinifaciens]|uniref:response regulator transcription factor n=1 Tax=Sphingomicrobium astaxanthinifaciens TaxID=1227949 RepID=UPI001FCA75C8|nr:response regulator transcription factor [Sphingomicrobium astaxanthinifaciens]MCJ7420392.1 response regulator transcription factor [Sphingomicrobium astaxanthinifaciens]
MVHNQKISQVFVVDQCFDRRTEICRSLINSDLVPQPLENLRELLGCWPQSGCILIGNGEEEAVAALKEAAAHEQVLPVFVLFDHQSIEAISDLIRMGAAGFVTWPSSGEGLARTLKALLSISEPHLAQMKDVGSARSRINSLSNREREVLRGISEGLSSKEIALQLGISYRTVEIHRGNMLGKVGAKNAIQAAKLAWKASGT